MKLIRSSDAGLRKLRITAALLLVASAIALGFFGFGFKTPAPLAGGMLRVEKLLFPRAQSSTAGKSGDTTKSFRPSQLPASAPTFGHPVISGIGGTGFEESIRLDPTNPNRIYTSAPGTLSADTSWVWHSLDGGKTFKWVVNAAPFEGKVTTCAGGGDSEIAVDSAGHLYFNDLSLVNFSTARSDDGGITFTCSNTGVPDTVVDRQWYAIDGDPTNGGAIYLTNDEVGTGGQSCPGTPLPGNNTLVMYRSPVGGLGTTAGIQFGPAYDITSRVVGCDEGIMGNNEVSPIATTLGQPNGMGGFATLPAPVKHVYVVHDNAALNKILIGRCFPVAFGVPVANVSDPSGLNCTDILISDLGAGQKTGGDFPTMAIDNAGNLYVVWEQAPVSGSVLTGDVTLKFAYSTDQGNTWSAPITIDTSGSPVGLLRQNVFAWINAGDDGRVNIVWYGTPNTPSGGNNAPDDCNSCTWYLWMTQSLNAHDPSGPVFTPPILASEHHVHRGAVQSLIGGQNQLASRSLGDYLQTRIGPSGEAHIAYVDSNNIIGSAVGHAMYVRQNGGTTLFAANSPVNTGGITPFNAVFDPSGDGKYEVSGTSSANMPQLDILGSNVSVVTTAPCSMGSPCYKVVMEINNLSLAPTTAQDPDPDLVWSTQWFVPSTSDPNGGKNFHVYAESFNGGALGCFVGENAVQLFGGGGVLTYPGNTQLPAANCQSTLGPNGNITIYVPFSDVNEPGPVDNRLHEVTASTMTLLQPANTNPSIGGIGGLFFNLIDVAHGYVFDPILAGAVSRKVHGAAGTFDIDLMPPAAGIECRSGGATGDYQVVVKFAAPVTSVSSATVSPAVGGSATIVGSPSVNGTEVTINLTNVSNAQTLTINLFSVATASTTGNLSVPMSILIGDTTASRAVNASDVSQTKAESGQPVTIGNFRIDVNANGAINSSDISLVKTNSGTALP